VPKKIWLNGKLVPPGQATVSVYDHGLLYGDGVFEGIRVYGGRIFKLMTHLRRLYASARAIRLPIPYSLQELAAATRETVTANDAIDGYIRLCVTRGVGTLGLNPFLCERAGVFIIADAIALYPPELYESGLQVITAKCKRTPPTALSPGIKSMNYLNNILAKIEAIDAGVLEAVMLNHHGNVAERTGDNIFIAETGNGQPVLRTPPLEAGVLEGVTRNTVIELAGKAGIEVRMTDMTRDQLCAADEVFLTGTAAEVIPVTKVDDRVIGDGKPGPVTGQMMSAFRALVADNAPED
jgi:branched-chain amino acid aminotransferase